MTSWLAGAVLASILNGVCQGIALAALVALALRAWPRANAATRYAVWSVTLALVAALPLLALVAAAPTPAAPLQPASSWRSWLALPAPAPWWRWLWAGWALGAALMLARVLWSVHAVARLKRRARPLDRDCQERFQRISSACRRPVRLCASAEVPVPVAVGLRHPMILVPEWLPAHLSAEEFEQVLLHELAHIRRRDDWTALAQKLAQAVFFFHPAIFWIGRRLDLEREIACDDWVVAATGRPRLYAACLARLLDWRAFGRSPQLAHGAVAPRPRISRRIEALLSGKRAVSPRALRSAAVAAAGALALAALLAARLAPVAVPPVPPLALRAAAIPLADPRAFVVPTKHDTWPRPSGSGPARPSYVLIQQWTIINSRDLTATYCIFYLRGAGQPGARSHGWVTILRLRPAHAPMNRA